MTISNLFVTFLEHTPSMMDKTKGADIIDKGCGGAYGWYVMDLLEEDESNKLNSKGADEANPILLVPASSKD